MDLNEYQNFVESTTSEESKEWEAFIERADNLDRVVNIPLLFTACIGLASECGEFSELVKKIVFQGKPMDADTSYHMFRELGDVCWYLANAANALDFSLEEIMAENVEKLKARYPNGFEVVRSENRHNGDL